VTDFELYDCKFFTRELQESEGKKKYYYKPIPGKYWKMRESGDWQDIQEIY